MVVQIYNTAEALLPNLINPMSGRAGSFKRASNGDIRNGFRNGATEDGLI
jgi:hypothetical protein